MFFDINNETFSPVLPLWKKDVQLKLDEHAWTVIIGETGSGKSWLLEKYAELLKLKQKKFSLIHQEPYLYNDTLENNIFLGLDRTPQRMEIAKKYLKVFGIDILASDLDSLLKMELGENGKRVSGGQAKRIALIRSLVADVEIVLWDDPFSSVDLILEAQIIQKLQNDEKLKTKTFVVTSHRLSTVKACEYIIYVDKKEGIIDQGFRQDKLNKETRIDEFFKKQMV